MADLNSTIVRGNLRVTENINTTGNINAGKLNLNAGVVNNGNIGSNGIYWDGFSLPEQTSPQFFCVIDSFGDGGRQKWTSLANAKSALGVPSFAAKGGITTPVYLSATNTFSNCSTYAGGTKVILNGTDKGASTASFYAPTSAISTTTSKSYLLGSSSTTSMETTNTNNYCYMTSNSIYAQYFYGTSDRRLKENIKDLDLNCLDLINNINLREFSWKQDEEHKPTVGAIAQELKQVLPEKYVHEFIGGKETDDEYLSINDSKLVYLLIGAIQEQQKEIESLKAKVDNKIV